MITYYRYVLRSEREAYEARGWVYDCDCGPYSVLMRWAGEGEPV